MDLYWGGSERRITGLTLRIISVNVTALIILVFGVLFLGQYQDELIATKLETFAAKGELVSAALSEGAFQAEDIELEDIKLGEPSKQISYSLDPNNARRMVKRLSRMMNQRIYIFDKDGALLIDSNNLFSSGELAWLETLFESEHSFYTIQVLKNMAGFFLKLFPKRHILPLYPVTTGKYAKDFPDALEALSGQSSISAWSNEKERIFLSVSIPLFKNDKILGALLITREARDIEEDVGQVWINILKIFLGTLIITVFLSIYLSGLIARPLRKLARAAESVRKGQSKANEIPDLSGRNDEIGELSIVLREMTQALWDRMYMIESFAADVAHELKNPLTSLKSAVETLEIITKKKDREQLLGIIKHDIERLDRLITDISSASRLDTELSRESFEQVNLQAVLHHLIGAYKDPLARTDDTIETQKLWPMHASVNNFEVRLTSDIEGECFVWALEGRLAQIFENLISNALSFSPEGGVVNIHVTPLGKRVMITIEDQGPGIPENKLETIFERFYSERPDHEAFGRHSGLGLSICRQIIIALGGQLFADNIKDETGKIKGACFSVILNRV